MAIRGSLCQIIILPMLFSTIRGQLQAQTEDPSNFLYSVIWTNHTIYTTYGTKTYNTYWIEYEGDNNHVEVVTVPSSIDGIPVVGIGNYAGTSLGSSIT